MEAYVYTENSLYLSSALNQLDKMYKSFGGAVVEIH